MERGGGAEFISWHPGRRERGTLALGSSMPPFIPLGPPTHGIVPPTLWVSIPLGNSLWKCPLTNLFHDCKSSQPDDQD